MFRNKLGLILLAVLVCIPALGGAAQPAQANAATSGDLTINVERLTAKKICVGQKVPIYIEYQVNLEALAPLVPGSQPGVPIDHQELTIQVTPDQGTVNRGVITISHVRSGTRDARAVFYTPAEPGPAKIQVRGELSEINTDGEVDNTSVAQPAPLEFEVLTCSYTIKGQADLTQLNAQLTAMGFDVTQRFDFEGKVQVNPQDDSISGKATGHSYVLARVEGCGFADNTDVYVTMPITGDSAVLKDSQQLALTVILNTFRMKSTVLICPSRPAPPRGQVPTTIEGFNLEIPPVSLEGGETEATAVVPNINITFKITITPRRAQ